MAGDTCRGVGKSKRPDVEQWAFDATSENYDEFDYARIEFVAGGSCNTYDWDGRKNMAIGYAVNGNKIVFDYGYGDEDECTVKSLSATQLVIEYNDIDEVSEGYEKQTFRKVN